MKKRIVLILTALVLGAAPSALPATSPAVVVSPSAKFNLSLRQASRQFGAGQTAAAAETLAQTCTQEKGSTGWHLELAQCYLQLARTFAENADTKNAAALARLVVQETQAITTAGKDNASAALALRGLVCERFLGDRTAAKANYAAALAANPKSAEAKKALDRLTQEDAILTAKLNAWRAK